MSIYGGNLRVQSVDEDVDLMLEAVENNSMTIDQAMRFVSEINSYARSKSESIQQIDTKIKCLELCVKQMKEAVRRKDTGEMIIYTLKSLIPFNWIFRAIKKSDKVAAYSWLGGLAGSFVGIGPLVQIICRAGGWKQMILDQISYTEESINYLKDEKKNMESNI